MTDAGWSECQWTTCTQQEAVACFSWNWPQMSAKTMCPLILLPSQLSPMCGHDMGKLQQLSDNHLYKDSYTLTNAHSCKPSAEAFELQSPVYHLTAASQGQHYTPTCSPRSRHRPDKIQTRRNKFALQSLKLEPSPPFEARTDL